MRHILGFFFFFFFLAGNSSEKVKKKREYVSISLEGQLGNQLFQIATAYAYALDHNLSLTIPDLIHKNRYNIPYNAQKLFLSRIRSHDLPSKPKLIWTEPSFNYTKIPNAKNVELRGYFQSENYFKHRRSEILSLFAAPQGLNDYIFAKYPFLLGEQLIVGIQIRDYRNERPNGDYHPTLGREYYEKAISYFPQDAIFLVSSNNLAHAKVCTEGLAPNMIYLSGQDYIEEFYTLVLCNSFITSNSSFGWWASWLSIAENKKVVAPSIWFSHPFDNKKMTRDIYSDGWVICY